jgi:hypothetical protein
METGGGTDVIKHKMGERQRIKKLSSSIIGMPEGKEKSDAVLDHSRIPPEFQAVERRNPQPNAAMRVHAHATLPACLMKRTSSLERTSCFSSFVSL